MLKFIQICRPTLSKYINYNIYIYIYIYILAIFYPPLEIDLGLCLAVFAGSGGKYLFHRIG